MKLTDEILNKYIDRELTAAEVKVLKTSISNDPEALERIKALKLTDEILRELEYDSAPQNFTEKLMNRLNVAYTSKPQKNYFIRTVFALFGLGFLGIFAFGISQASLGSKDKDGNLIQAIFDKIGEILPSLNFTINLSSDLMMLIVSVLFLITLIGTYVIINSHKVFKNNIENLSH